VAPWWWFLCKPKHFEAASVILICFNNPKFFYVVWISLDNRVIDIIWRTVITVKIWKYIYVLYRAFQHNYKICCYVCLFSYRYNPLWSYLSQPSCGLYPPRFRGFFITHNDAPQSVELLWTSDQSVAETSTLKHTTLTTDKHPCPRWDSNPQSQQASGRRRTP